MCDLLLVEAILLYKKWKIEDWDKIYSDIPSRQVKVVVDNRHFIQTNENATLCLRPEGLQAKIDLACSKAGLESRAFVRPSGTEDIVRVYAEAVSQKAVDDLAKEVAQLVRDFSKIL